MANACRVQPPVVVELAKPPPRNYVVRLTVYRKDNTTLDLDSVLMTAGEAHDTVAAIQHSEEEARVAIGKKT